MRKNLKFNFGPFSIEVSKYSNQKNNLEYDFKIYNALNKQTKLPQSSDTTQLDCLQEYFYMLQNRDYKEYGCLVESTTTYNQTQPNLIESFRYVYKTTVTTDEERLESYYIDIIRQDYVFKHSEFEQVQTETSFSLVFGFPIPNYQFCYETIEIANLGLEQISEFVESVSTFINTK